MKRQTISFVYSINIVMQALFTLVFWTAAFFGVGYLLTLAGVDDWVYIPTILSGLALGVWSMIKFVIVATTGLERLERAAEKKGKRGSDE